MTYRKNRVVVRGAGEMASGVISCLYQAGYEVIALEQASPSCIRREVCFAEAVYEKEFTVEGITSELVNSVAAAEKSISKKRVPILIDPSATMIPNLKPLAVVDGRLLKKDIDTILDMAPIIIGLGPGFTVGVNCHVAIETNRGPKLGNILYAGSPSADTGQPAVVDGVTYERVLRAPVDGVFISNYKITDKVAAGVEIGRVGNSPVISRINGMVRGLIRDESVVAAGQKIGDIDPRGIKENCTRISDKANVIGVGTLGALQALQEKLIEYC